QFIRRVQTGQREEAERHLPIPACGGITHSRRVTLLRSVAKQKATIIPMQPNTGELVSQLPRLAPRAADSNKGSFGRVLVVAGSRGMSGAAILCGSAALRGGAGLVRVAVPAEILPIVAGNNPCYLTAPLPQDSEGQLDRQAEAELLALLQT